VRCCWPQQKERREQGVDDGDAVDDIAVSAELERTVWDVLAAPALEDAEDDGCDLGRRLVKGSLWVSGMLRPT
jgi:hypothetical protein